MATTRENRPGWDSGAAVGLAGGATTIRVAHPPHKTTKVIGCPSCGAEHGHHEPTCVILDPIPNPERCVLAGGCYVDPPWLDEALDVGGCARCGRRWPEGGLV